MANTPIRRRAVYTRKSSEEGLEQDFNSAVYLGRLFSGFRLPQAPNDLFFAESAPLRLSVLTQTPRNRQRPA